MSPQAENDRNQRESVLTSLMSHRGYDRFPLIRVLAGYAAASFLCMATLLMRLGIGYDTGDPPMLVLYMIPVIASAFIGGLGPGLFCTTLAGFLAGNYLLAPLGNLSISNTDAMLNLGTMLFTGMVISILVEALHRSLRRTEESQERYRIVADNTYDWEFWIDPQGKSIYQSPSCKRVTGYDASEFLADPQQLEQLVHPDDVPLFKSHRHGVVSDKSHGDLLFRIVRPDGEVRWIEHFCQPVFGHNGAYLGARGSNSDVTDRKRMEEVMVRTEKMSSVGGLAAGMAHEINNPLSGILQNLQNIKRRINLDLPANLAAAQEQGCSLEMIRNYLKARHVCDFLDAIEAAGKKAARIVGNMMEFSCKGTADKVPANVNEIAEKAITLCTTGHGPRDKSNFRDILIERDFAPNILRVLCIPSQIEQVLVNLLQNAEHALRSQTKTNSLARITVRTSRENDAVRIEVEDNGPGMKPEVLKHVLDPFFTTKPVGKGTGLGLSVSYFIITNNHGGSVEVESVPGEGARFIIRLPLEPARP